MEQFLPSDVRRLLRTYGQRVRTARIRRRWSQAELAERIGVERRTVSRMESGDPGVRLGALLTALWILDLWRTAQNVADPAADKVGMFLDKQRQPKRARRRQQSELDF